MIRFYVTRFRELSPGFREFWWCLGYGNIMLSQVFFNYSEHAQLFLHVTVKITSLFYCIYPYPALAHSNSTIDNDVI